MFFNSLKKKTDWSLVILKPVNHEVRESLSLRIAELFRMSSEESDNVVLNTPNLFLDNLKEETAMRVKKAFEETGGDILLTQDEKVRSKCYRTVWPEPPNLTFLRRKPKTETPEEEEPIQQAEIEDLPAEPESAPVMDQESEKATFMDAVAEKGKEFKDSARELAQKGSDLLSLDFEEWKAKYEDWKQSFSELSESSEKHQQDEASFRQHMDQTQRMVQAGERELADQKRFFQRVNEQFEKLRMDSQQKRAQFENQLNRLNQEVNHWRAEAQKATNKLDATEEEFVNQLKSFKEQMDTWKAEFQQANGKISDIEASRGQLLASLEDQDRQFNELREGYENSQREFEGKVAELSNEVTKWKSESHALKESSKGLELEREELEKKLSEQESKYQELEKEYTRAKKFVNSEGTISAEEYVQWKVREAKVESRLEMFEKIQAQMSRELDERRHRETILEEKLNDRAQSDSGSSENQPS